MVLKYISSMKLFYENNDALSLSLKQELEKITILSQYGRLVRRVNTLFYAISKFTSSEKWRIDGVGSCVSGVYFVGDNLKGVAMGAIRDKWNLIAEDERLKGAVLSQDYCPYHKEGAGCVLGDFKPSRCLSYIDAEDEELSVLFGINALGLDNLIRKSLDRVMLGSVPAKHPDWLCYPEGNELYVQKMERVFTVLADRIETRGMRSVKACDQNNLT